MFIGMCLFPWGRAGQGEGLPAVDGEIMVGDDDTDIDLTMLGDDDTGTDLVMVGEE